MTIRQRKPTAFLVAAIAGIAVLASKDYVRINFSDSMPIGLWFVRGSSGELKRGDVVTLCLPRDMARVAHRNGYIGTGGCENGYGAILKPIGAVAGDVVIVSETGLSVNGDPLPNTAAKQADSHGRLMNPVRPGEYRVEPGTFWIIAPRHELSFDSRYFGPVALSSITGTAFPLLVSE